MNEVTELQKKRAVNTIWNTADNYGFQPDFKAYDSDGNAEIYLNCIIGGVYRYYDYPKLAELFSAFSRYEDDADTYEGLLWLGLENAVYPRLLQERPVLESLRRDYAKRLVSMFGNTAPDDYYLLDCLTFGHYLRVLGTEPEISRYDRRLLDELEFSPDLDTDEIISLSKELLQKWFQITNFEKRKERKPFVLFTIKQRNRRSKAVRLHKYSFSFFEHPKEFGTQANDSLNRFDVKTKLSEEEMQAFIAGKFGKPIYSKAKTAELERQLCSGNHSFCHLHFTRGEYAPETIRSSFEAYKKEEEAKQRLRNRKYYKDRYTVSRAAIAKLSGAIQNSVLLHLQPTPVIADTGLLCGGRAWRAQYLDDNRIFIRNDQDNLGDFCVDILLDASTSQEKRQDIVSYQAFIIAEALTRCGVPCRVSSFCSMSGFTIMHIFREYNSPHDNEKIFDFVSNGSNRDGLGIRAEHYLMNLSPYEHKLLIILSDVKPNDSVKIDYGPDRVAYYENEAGLNDTAIEVRRARSDGIAVVCVFTGEDRDIPSARLVYGHDFARIASLDRLSDTVAMLIQNQLRML